MTDTSFTDNSAGTSGNPNTGGGGGMSIAGATPAVLTRTFFVNNKALNGGGLYTTNNTSIVDGQFLGNSGGAASPGSGGGIYVTGAFTVGVSGTSCRTTPRSSVPAPRS